MKCEEVHEHLSALCDGELIPSDAAEHIGACEFCRERMNGYLKVGVELRRLASADMGEVHAGVWKQTQRKAPSWWGKGWETMRIPRLAFALMLIGIVVLGSSLLIVRVRAQAEGSVLMLNVKLPTGGTFRCALSLVDERNNSCASLSPPRYLLGIKVLSHSEDQIELGIRAKYTPLAQLAAENTSSLDDLKTVEEKQYKIRPGDQLEVAVPGWGTLSLIGELMDHMPPFVSVASGIQMDPNLGELQIVSPLLLRDRKVVCDFENSAATGEKGVQMYVPGEGRWIISLMPLEGAIEAKADLNRLSFESNGHSYSFVTAATVARSGQHIWVLRDESYRAPSGLAQYIGGIDPARWKQEAR